MRRFSLFVFATFSLAVTACREPLEVPAGCQPLFAGSECMLPFPSDFFRVPDATQPSGFAIRIEDVAKVKTADQKSADPQDWRKIDGFSRLPIIVAFLEGPVTASGLVGIFDPPDRSLSAATSHTLIIDPDTGKTIPHFTDLDPFATSPDRQAIVLHPIVRLEAEHRYVVAIFGMADKDGELIKVPEGFRRLRDGEAADDAALSPLVSVYDSTIFPAVEAAGVGRDSLQLAWAFTTGADAAVESDLLTIRKKTLEFLAANPPSLEIDSVVEDNEESALVWRRIEGHVTAPLFLESTQYGAELAMTPEGEVRQNGTTQIGFTAIVPRTMRDDFGPARIIGHGHGFFSTREGGVGSDAMIDIGTKLHAVVIGVDWWGFYEPDRERLTNDIVTEPSKVLRFTNRIEQSMASWMTLNAAVKGAVTATTAFKRPAIAGAPGVSTDMNGASNAGALLYDPAHVYFIGISLGHILGGVITALDPTIERAVLHVGGAPLSHMMYRSGQFTQFLKVIENKAPDPLDRQKFVATLVRHMDRIDPGQFAPYVLDRKLEGSPPDRQVLLQIGIGDAQVPNFSSFIHARLLKIGYTSPSPIDPWGLEAVTTPHQGSALTIFDTGQDPSFYAKAMPPDVDNPVHGDVRKIEAAIEEMDQFLKPTGVVMQGCDGPCDPQ
jgi:hypothetical protein